MSSLATLWNEHTLSILLRLLVILLAASLANRFLRRLSRRIIRPAAGQSRAEQGREQQTQMLADAAYRGASAIVWLTAILTALPQIGISPLPAVVVVGAAGLSLGLAATGVVRDVIGGSYILWEDQFMAGETVQIGETLGRVEQLTLRRTVLRDARGAQVSIANSEIRTVANLSRDWSQAFVDVAFAPETSLDKPLAALERATADLRSDAAWSQALVEGPRVLGVQSYDRNGSVVRLQVKTLPLRQEEISRELRRRIQLSFQKENIPVANVLRVQLANSTGSEADAIPQQST